MKLPDACEHADKHDFETVLHDELMTNWCDLPLEDRAKYGGTFPMEKGDITIGKWDVHDKEIAVELEIGAVETWERAGCHEYEGEAQFRFVMTLKINRKTTEADFTFKTTHTDTGAEDHEEEAPPQQDDVYRPEDERRF